MNNETSEESLYLRALMPTHDDKTDISASTETDSEAVEDGAAAAEQKDTKDEDKMDTSMEQEKILDSSMEMYENPFLKLTKS